jgi:3-hydroxyisobutyrate dehydrogenase-like beta-hydroxyacid dehydrogenase
MAEEIGLIGIGLVGTALAENLLRGGYHVAGYDVNPERRDALDRMGGSICSNAAEVACRVRRVFLSLWNTDTVCQVVEGSGGILEGSDIPEIVIDTTTGDPDKTAELARRLAPKRVDLLDATLSGSSEQIRRRKAVFMVGGEASVFESCADLFDACAERSFYLGPSGSGSKAKLANNLILGLNRLVLAEGLEFGRALGLDAAVFLDLCKASPAYSCAMDVKGEKMVRGDFRPQSRIRQHLKDLEIMLEYAEKSGAALNLGQVHLDLLKRAVASGDGDQDTSAVIRHLGSTAKG